MPMVDKGSLVWEFPLAIHWMSHSIFLAVYKKHLLYNENHFFCLEDGEEKGVSRPLTSNDTGDAIEDVRK